MTTQHAFARTDRSRLGVWWWTTDRWLLGAAALLILIGVFLSFASSPAAAARIGISDPFHFALRQSVFACAAATIMVIVSSLSARGVRRVAFFTYVAAIAIMMALPFIGHEAKGATRWLNMGAFSLQPSEFMKPALIVMVAWMFSEGQKGQGVPGATIAFGLYILAVILLTIEKDFGQTVLITLAFGAAFFMVGVPMKWIAGLMAVAGAFGALIATQSDHVMSRFERFRGAEGADTHQIDRASEAIANGGLFGRGPGEGVMKRSVPDLHTDFIYSVGAEEYGLILSLLLIGLFGFIVLRGLSRALRLSDSFSQVAAAGLFLLVGMQSAINIAVNLNLAPTKGMTLPFISYGGSSMLAMGLTLGMALALIGRRPGAYAQDRASQNPFA